MMRLTSIALALVLALMAVDRAAALSPDPQPQGFAALTGTQATVTGYVLPVDEEGGLIQRFALVPYSGACSHMPAPPAESVILITPDKPMATGELYEYVTITGLVRMKPEVSRFFLIDGDVTLRSNYVVTGAEIRRSATPKPADPFPGNSPWKDLHK